MGVMEENLKEEIEFWQFLIEEAEKCGDIDSIQRLTDALKLAEYKLNKCHLKLFSSHNTTG